MEPPLHMRCIVDQNIIVQCMTVYVHTYTMALGSQALTEMCTRNISWRGLRQLMYKVHQESNKSGAKFLVI